VPSNLWRDSDAPVGEEQRSLAVDPPHEHVHPPTVPGQPSVFVSRPSDRVVIKGSEDRVQRGAADSSVVVDPAFGLSLPTEAVASAWVPGAVEYQSRYCRGPTFWGSGPARRPDHPSRYRSIPTRTFPLSQDERSARTFLTLTSACARPAHCVRLAAAEFKEPATRMVVARLLRARRVSADHQAEFR